MSDNSLRDASCADVREFQQRSRYRESIPLNDMYVLLHLLVSSYTSARQ
jgi:hypothetical protein